MDFYRNKTSMNDATNEILYHLMNMNTEQDIKTRRRDNMTSVPTGIIFFAYFTPIILCAGVLGNVVSVFVFGSANMRKLTASAYLIALSLSDTMSLLSYVLVEWLQRAVPMFTGESVYNFDSFPVVKCQIRLYVSYVSRFLSAWLIVVFTIERFIAVCYPLKLRSLSSVYGARRNILCMVIIACILVIFKPVLSGTYLVDVRGNSTYICTSSVKHRHLSFILDSVYSCLLTVLPVLLIMILNILIIRQIVIRRKSRMAACQATSHNIITLEFTLILLIISFCFVGLNIPYFCVWCTHYFRTRNIADSVEITNEPSLFRTEDLLLVTKTIFFANYCINFFLYCLTGAYFRQSLKGLFRFRFRFERKRETTSSLRSRHSWL